MLVIHGTWAYGVLSLWAEDSGRPASAGLQPRRTSRAPRPHPFAADPDVLADAVAALAGASADLARRAIEDELPLRLPSAPDGPQASPELGRAADAADGAAAAAAAAAAGRGEAARGALAARGGAAPAPAAAAAVGGQAARAALAAWRVPALTFDPPVAADLLAALGDPGAGSVSAVAGGSVLYLAALARLADDLAGRGRVLPTMAASDDGRYAARWRAVLSGPDAQRARGLAAAMPPLCRADAGSEPSAVLVTDALDALADASARARLGRDPEFRLLPARAGRRPSRIPVAERWAAALTGTDAQVPVTTPQDHAEGAELAHALHDGRAAARAPAGPVRRCFRLVEPGAEPDAATWTVELALQSTDDPSLLLPAADIWSGDSAGGWAAAGIRHPEEELLAGLGTASRLFAELDQELRTPAPEEVTLDTEGAARFLQQTGPLLAGAGFGVLLPDWVGGARKRLGLKITTKTRSTPGAAPAAESKFGMGDLVDFRYDLAVGDESLSPQELEELARLKVPLVRLRGQWVELDDRHLQAALKFLERSQDRAGTMTAAEALLDGLGGIDDELPVVGVDADGWLGDLLSGQAHRRLAPFPTPASFRGDLRPYQERGLAWLSFLGDLGLGAVLADSMGLGKCICPDTSLFVNGALFSAEDVWNRFATGTWNDGQGEWAIAAEPLTVNALASVDGRVKVAAARIARLYRQHVSEKVRRVRLDDGSEVVITRRHKLLGLNDWTNEFAPGDRICVPSRLEWSGKPVDPDLTTLLAWQIAEGCEDQNRLRICQKNVAILEDLMLRVQRLAGAFKLEINRPRLRTFQRRTYLRINSSDYRTFLTGLGYN